MKTYTTKENDEVFFVFRNRVPVAVYNIKKHEYFINDDYLNKYDCRVTDNMCKYFKSFTRKQKELGRFELCINQKYFNWLVKKYRYLINSSIRSIAC